MTPDTVPPVPACPVTSDVWGFRRDKPASRDPAIAAIAVLDIEYNELVQAWKRLVECLQLENNAADCQERFEDSQSLSSVLRNVQARWSSGPHQAAFARPMSLCDEFLSTVDAHSLLVAILPKSESYTSLFYEVVQSVIKASAPYPKVIEGLLKLLIEINKAIRLPVGREPPSSAKDAIPRAAKFYALTFFFLGEFMDWYVRKAVCRLLKGRSLDVYSEFQTVIDCIKSTTREVGVDEEPGRDSNMKPTWHLWEEARLSQLGLRGYERRLAAQNAMVRHLMWEMQQDASQRVRLKREGEIRLWQMLDSVTGRLYPNRERTGADQGDGACLLTTAPGLDTSRVEHSMGPKRQFTRGELQLASRHLEDFFERDDQVSESDTEVITEDSILPAFHRWATEPHSQVLAVGGSPSAARISECYARLARKSKVPVISHFCSLPSQPADCASALEHGLVSLAYSLIRQLIDCLPPVLGCCASYDLGAERFSLLDGTLASWKEVLSLIGILLDYAPPLLFCVVDGLDVLRDQSTSHYIQSLLRAFLVHVGRQSVLLESQQLHKVLFTISGPATWLEEVVSEPLTGKSNGA